MNQKANGAPIMAQSEIDKVAREFKRNGEVFKPEDTVITENDLEFARRHNLSLEDLLNGVRINKAGLALQTA